ncbi:LANO_0D06502g1_1 [Lachancea nothofagi CBS 11611]|uniref:LANO_0D06502g1_1 n=1 Tax=Lachancea nothofagi CBS 11611 TaxID=1266666 RepID=A0A1G4JHF7_9SACH|nr:LANO_0D06502g1_1 [Lachancea nothofagi CBS 11611]
MSIDSPSYEPESPAGRRSMSATGRVDYTIEEDDLDIREDEKDEDYKEDAVEDDDNDDEVIETENEKSKPVATNNRPVIQEAIVNVARFPTQPRRGRPPKRKNIVNVVETALPIIDSSKANSDGNGGNNNGFKRPHLSFPVDESGNPLPVINDEYALPDDPEGDTKINRDGDLLGGRQFLVRSFTVASRGERKYMLSTEPARAVGFRDSYLFFQYHPNLYKLTISQEERDDLIHRGVIPYSYRTRTITLVTARGVFKEFGAKIIVEGKNITDDYYVGRLREEGRVVEGTYAREPTSNLRGMGAKGFKVSSLGVNPSKNAVEFFDRRNHNITPGSNISSTNWLYQHAAACSRFNSDLFYDRERVLLIEHQGLRDPYTNTLHLPQSTQSTQVLRYVKDSSNVPENNGVVYETLIEDKDLTRRCIGIKDVPLDIFEDVVDDDIKLAILEQQQFEKNV